MLILPLFLLFQMNSEKVIMILWNNLFRARRKIQKKRELYLCQIFPYMDINGDNRAGGSMSPFSVRKQEFADWIKPVYFALWINQGSWFIISTSKIDLSMLHKKEIKRNWENFWSIIKIQHEIYFPADKISDHRFTTVQSPFYN